MFENINVTSSFKNAVTSAVEKGRLSHAVILEGTREDIRFSAAKEIAKAILCKGTLKPCGNCNACFKVSSDSHPDLHILKKEDGSAMIKVDAIRDVKDKAKVYPNDGDKSVFIIHEAQFMNTQAQNALLKIFEEPSSHVSFILTCPSKSSLLDTIVSRATVYFLGEEEDSGITDEKAQAAKDKAQELLISFITENELQFIRRTAVFQKDKPLFLLTLKAMIPVIRDALVLSGGSDKFISDSQETAKRIKNTLTQRKILMLAENIGALIENTENTANHNLTLTRLSAVMYSVK